MIRLRTLRLVVIVALPLLAACGFQLRGNYAIPFGQLHLGLPENTELHARLRRAIEAASETRIVAGGDSAVRLVVLQNAQSKGVLSVNAAGRVREYELVRTFRFRLVAPGEQVLIPESTITLKRDITFSDEQVLSKEAEEAILWQDMQADLVQQLLRRLAAAKAPAS